MNTLPLYTPTTLPTISGTMIMLRKGVFTHSGFSSGGASFFAFLNFLLRAIGLRFRPLLNRLRGLHGKSSISCSQEKTQRFSIIFQKLGFRILTSSPPPISKIKAKWPSSGPFLLIVSRVILSTFTQIESQIICNTEDCLHSRNFDNGTLLLALGKFLPNPNFLFFPYNILIN